MLEDDITSGKIDEIMGFYKNNLGDHLFVIAEK